MRIVWTETGTRALIASIAQPDELAVLVRLSEAYLSRINIGNFTNIARAGLGGRSLIGHVERDPLRIIPVLIVGSIPVGALALIFGSELRVPHGAAIALRRDHQCRAVAD